MQEQHDHPGVRRASRMMVIACAFTLTLHALGKGAPLSLGGATVIEGCLIASLGLSVRWSSWMPGLLHDPGEDLALESKVLGWAAAGALPWIVEQRQWIWLPIATATPVISLALWMRRRWAYGPGMLAAAALALVGLVKITLSVLPAARGEPVDRAELFHGLKLTFQGLALARALKIWLKRLGSRPSPPIA